MTDQIPRTDLQLELVSPDTIEPNSWNPNRQTTEEFDLLIKSMREDGFTTPIVADRATRIVVDGEHRWRAAQAIGPDLIPLIPVIWVDMDEAEMRTATLRHNRARGQEDVSLAAELLRDLEQRGGRDGVLESLGMTGDELDFMLKDVIAPEVLTAPEVVEAKERDPDDQTAIADATRAAEARIEQEKKQESALNHAADEDTFRIDLSFTNEEGAIVGKVLGKRPADKILELIRNAA